MTSLGHVTTERISIDKLNPAEYNPRDITDRAREGLSNSINSFGLLQPIIWNKRTGNVVGGHQRLYDIISKGALETDVIVVDFPLAKEKAANIALNHTGISGHYTEDKLQALLAEISADTFEALNFEELKLPDWDDIPDVGGDLSLKESSTKIVIKIPKKNEYIRDEVMDMLRATLQEHWPEHELTIE